jgi:hypothetical protein
VRATHSAELEAAQTQSRAVVTLSVPLVPDAGAVSSEADADTVHLPSLGVRRVVEDWPQAEA